MLMFCAPFILVVIALNQIYLAQVKGLTPWKGGGFGMFSTIDSTGARNLQIFLDTESDTFKVNIPADPKISKLAERARAMPSRTTLLMLGGLIAEKRWVPANYDPFLLPNEVVDAHRLKASTLNGTDATLSFDTFLSEVGSGSRVRPAQDYENPNSAQIAKVKTVRLELWKYDLDPATSTLSMKKHIEVTLPVREAL